MRTYGSLEMDSPEKNSLRNPFDGLRKPEKQLSMKYMIWEVLKESPSGLTVTEIVLEMERKKLKDFSGKRNAQGQVSGDLVRHREFFIQDPDRKVWYVRPLAPSRWLEAPMLTRSKSKRGRPTKQSHAIRNASLADKPKGKTLVGARVSVWWAGDNTFFNGEIVAFENESNSYTVIYDDGDADNGIQFRNYEVVWKDGRVQLVRVYETDQDEMELAGNAVQSRLLSNGITETSHGGALIAADAAATTRLGSGQSPSGPDLNRDVDVAAENFEGGEVMNLEHDIPEFDDVMDERGEPQRSAERPEAGLNSSVRTPSLDRASSPLVNKSPVSTMPHSEAGQGNGLIKPRQFLESAIRCADHIWETVSAYQDQHLDTMDLYNRMRGTPLDSVDLPTMGELAARVESTAVDCGQFAVAIESETSGMNRFMWFCIEGFIKSAESMDGYLHQLLEFGQRTLRQLVECVPDERLHDVQDVMDSTSPLPGQNSLQKLKVVEQQIREITGILSGA
ncbi:hypothetical protein BSKO_00562 [Bryopsis sp. KO-2023]|nr:hypothetical protein BSKO_00562 [Bryopsis sp. KO-2023]